VCAEISTAPTGGNIGVKKKDQSFKSIGFRSLFGHFLTEKTKLHE
jgi:hypothetical protein